LTPDQRLLHHPAMDRRRFLLTSLAGVPAAPLAAEGEQARKVHRIGRITPELPMTPGQGPFWDRMRELG
jgi:hypothetical protein